MDFDIVDLSMSFVALSFGTLMLTVTYILLTRVP